MQVGFCENTRYIPSESQSGTPIFQLQGRGCIEKHPHKWSFVRISVCNYFAALDCDQKQFYMKRGSLFCFAIPWQVRLHILMVSFSAGDYVLFCHPSVTPLILLYCSCFSHSMCLQITVKSVCHRPCSWTQLWFNHFLMCQRPYSSCTLTTCFLFGQAQAANLRSLMVIHSWPSIWNPPLFFFMMQLLKG